MTDKEYKTPVMIAGPGRCGKTTFICSLIQLGYRSNLNIAGLKPFDTGLLDRNASEEISDGSLFCRNMTGDPMEILVSPYVAHETYPVEMAFRRDGIKINWGFISERLIILKDLYDITLLEMPGGLCTPITENKTCLDWIRETGFRTICLLNASRKDFEQNLAEIALIKALNVEVDYIISNTAPIEDQDLLFFMWEKYEQLAEQEIAGMVPFIRELDNDFAGMADKIAQALPNLMEQLLTS